VRFRRFGFTYKDFELSGVLQEIPGPSARCPSGFGGTILGFGTAQCCWAR
jgi:hypothetical protein